MMCDARTVQFDPQAALYRYRLEALFEQVLAGLMVGYEDRAAYGAQLAAAQRLLGRDPLREDAHRAANAHRAAVRAYCHLGQHTAALEQYRRCQQVLMAELDTEPAAETTGLYQEVLEGRFEIGPAPEVFAVEEFAPVPPPGLGRSPLDAIGPGVKVGREEELAFLDGCWQGAEMGEGSLALISGEAGVGKTQLVEEFAHRLGLHSEKKLWGRCYEFERALSPRSSGVGAPLFDAQAQTHEGGAGQALGPVAALD